jgi:TPR repeat protein
VSKDDQDELHKLANTNPMTIGSYTALGIRYLHGWDTRMHYELAYEAFCIATEGDKPCAHALYHVSEMYWNDTVPSYARSAFASGPDSYQKAAYLLMLRAANLHHAAAQLKMGHKCLVGAGCERSISKAYMWYHLASARGCHNAREHIMTGLQLGETSVLEGSRLATEWIESLPYDQQSHYRKVSEA